METPKRYFTKILTTAFVVLLFMSILLFYARLYCHNTLINLLPIEARYVKTEPSGLLPQEFEKDPNVGIHSSIHAGYYQDIFSEAVGLTQYAARTMENPVITHYDEGRYCYWLYFDTKTGLLSSRIDTIEDKLIVETTRLYAGPNGMAIEPADSLGKFEEPIISTDDCLDEFVIYDRKIRRFFLVDFPAVTVKKGKQLSNTDLHNPVEIGFLWKSIGSLSLDFSPPKESISEEQAKARDLLGTMRNGRCYDSTVDISRCCAKDRLLVLDASGRIDLFDIETLDFAGVAGYLPAPRCFFSDPKKQAEPKDLLAYGILPVSYQEKKGQGESDIERGTYAGLAVATLNREGNAIALSVFDLNGRLIKTEHSRVTRGQSRSILSSEAFYSASAWAPFHTTLEYIIENLQPPVLSLFSYLVGDSIEAVSGHSGLFILPDSFVAMVARAEAKKEGVAWEIIVPLLMVGPSLILSFVLAWRVNADATKVGLPENAKLFWLTATLAFGPAAYITYKLTLPQIDLVTCKNCGKLRRPDMGTCHRCGAGWEVPELTPPAWRVID